MSFRPYHKVDSEQCIKLLTRCSKMYDAKQAILKLLKLSIEKDTIVDELK